MFGMAISAPIICWAQTSSAVPSAAPGLSAPAPAQTGRSPPQRPFLQGNLQAWAGLRVIGIRFEGVSEATLKPLPDELAQQTGEPLDPAKIRDSLRRLYITGLYQTIQVAGIRNGNDVSIIFSGVPRLFLRRVNVNGVKDSRLSSILQSSTELQAGTAFTPAKAAQGERHRSRARLSPMAFTAARSAAAPRLTRATLSSTSTTRLSTGQPARIGDVQITGQSGLTEQQFRKRGKLKRNSKVDRNTVSRALSRLRKNYAKNEHLAASVTLTSNNTCSRPIT